MIKIIGIGSPFSDDRLGWNVIEQLQATFDKTKMNNIDFLTCDRPNMSLISLMKGADEVILIDAVKSENLPGTIVRLSPDDIFESQILLSSHDFGVKHALELAHSLNLLPKQLTLYGIEIGTLSYNDQLSSDIADAIPMLVSELSQYINALHDSKP